MDCSASPTPLLPPIAAQSADDAPVTWRRAAVTSAALCLFFLVVYGACNNYTAMRSDVGVWVYAWERHIPFVPLMILPYLSIDLFFIAAPFLCSNRRELSVLSRRILLAIAVAAICFLVMPLRFSFERPPAPGVLGVVFDWFRAMDKPYNQLPSLHIALRTILAVTYARHTRGWTRAASAVWFSLIGVSTLLTYQHHVIDVFGGFVLGVGCLYVIGESRRRLPVTRSPRVGLYYLGGAVLLAGVAGLIAWAWTPLAGVALLWPAAALAIVAGAYFGLGPSVFRKHDGRIPWASYCVLGPVILGQELSRRHYARRSAPWDAITDRVWVGRTLSIDEARHAVASGVTAVLDLTGELPEAAAFRAMPGYRCLPIMDLTAPTAAQLDEAVAFIDRQAHGDVAGVVYVHCKAGYSRSAAVVAAWLTRSRQARTVDAALDLIRRRRPGIIVRPEVRRALAAVESSYTSRRD